MATVSLKSLSKRYPGAGAAAVDRVDLTVDHGEFMVLLGPSGCGKSTTLRMIAGLEAISDGELAIDGRRMNGVPARDRDIAMVFQSYALYPHMTVRDNLAFGLRRRAFARAEVDRRVREVGDLLGLTTLMERKPHALSGGQRQRVALGRAIVRDPKVFLFDEPLSNLDASLRASTRAELIKLHRRLGATMIYVTHDQVEAMTMGQRICIMNGGRVVQIGAPLDVYRRPADVFVAGFLGNPPMNLIPADVDGESLLVGSTRLAWPGPIPQPARRSARATLGVRPEDLSLAPAGAATLPATVVAVEPLGADTLAQVRLAAGTEAWARLGRDATVCIADEIHLLPDLARACLFDADSGTALD